VDFFRTRLVAEGAIAPKDLELFVCTDSVQDAVEHIKAHPHGCRSAT
jgi:predicted Rossmann-fold nucleotide-binding protein